MERRTFLTAAAATPVIAAFPARSEQGSDGGQAATLRLATSAFRRLDGTTPSRQLSEPVLAHLRLAQTITADAENREQKARLAAVGSEAASLAGWLAWDMGDHGSARTWYGSAITAAGTAGDRMLAAYQIGSLAQFEAHSGNAAQALNLVRMARRQLAGSEVALAHAWLSSVEALAHAAGGDARGADRALLTSATAAARIPSEQVPPWPWVFAFTETKVAAVRLTCGAKLGLPEWVSMAQGQAGEALASGHEKQRALLMLDLASAQMALGRLDGAFALALSALETGIRYRSGRVVERARALRRSYKASTTPRIVRDFDERLQDIFV